MIDIQEVAFQICRYMLDNGFTDFRDVTVGVVREALNLTFADFDAADTYLRDKNYYNASSAGDDALLSLKTRGIDFVNWVRTNRLDLSSDAEQLAKYLANNHSTLDNTAAYGTEIKATFQWNDNQYWAVCQNLQDEELIDVSASQFEWIKLNAKGRKAVLRNFRRSVPAMNVNTGNISVENSNGNVAINNNANNNNIAQNIQNNEINQFFEEIISQVEKQQDLSAVEKESIKDSIELAQDEAKEKTPNEKKLTSYLQNIALMAPDILDVAIAAASAPIAGPLPLVLVIAKKVSEKAKTFTQKKTTK